MSTLMIGDESLDRAFRLVLLADGIHSEHIGYEMVRSEVHDAWKRVRHEVAVEDMIDAFESASPAGKAYFLGPIAEQRPDVFLELSHLLHDESSVTELHGDQGFMRPLHDLYLNRLIALSDAPDAFALCLRCATDASFPTRVRELAFGMLANRQPEAVREMAQRWLEGDDLRLRSLAIDSKLVAKPDSEWVLFHTDFSTAVMELRTAIHLQPPHLTTLLERVLREHRDMQIRFLALEEYLRRDDADPELLKFGLSDPDPRVPAHAMYGLIRHDPEAAVDNMLAWIAAGYHTRDLIKIMCDVPDERLRYDPIPLEPRIASVDRFAAAALAADPLFPANHGHLEIASVVAYVERRKHPTLIVLAIRLLDYASPTVPWETAQMLLGLGLPALRSALEAAAADPEDIAHATAVAFTQSFGLDDFSIQRGLQREQPDYEALLREMMRN